MSWRVRLLGLAGAVAFGCTSGPTAPSTASAACAPHPASANAVVMTAGLEAPNFCPQLNRTVQALLVVLVHTAPTGELYASIYGHLSRIDVQAGASVSEGTVIGLSGNTGCSGTPHLHFGVGRSVAGRYVLIDPYGWHAPTG